MWSPPEHAVVPWNTSKLAGAFFARQLPTLLSAMVEIID